MEKEETIEFGHHDYNPGFQSTFADHVAITIRKTCWLGNPLDNSHGKDLIQIITKYVMDESVVKTIRTIEEFGKKAYDKFVKERIHSPPKRIDNPNKLK